MLHTLREAYGNSPFTPAGFVRDHTDEGPTIYTDEASAYAGLGRDYQHEAFKHSVCEYVRGLAHTQGIESFWSMLKRAYKGTFHKMSEKHLNRYVQEFAGQHNDREEDTAVQMGSVAKRMVGKRLRYKDLTADDGLDNGLPSPRHEDAPQV